VQRTTVEPAAIPLSKPNSSVNRQRLENRWLHAEYYGRDPTHTKTFIVDDVVVVVLEETFTPSEQALIEHGELEAIQNIRRRSNNS
jgi:uncharacterized protein YbcI